MVVAVSVVAAYANREQLAIKIKSVYAPVTPKPVTPFSERAKANGAFSGEGAWVLSALPECFSQTSRTTGPPLFVLGHLPKPAVLVPAGTTIFAGDCRVFVRGGDVWAWRGKDRLRVPGPARLYQGAANANRRTLALLQGRANAFDLRVYEMAPASQSHL